VNLVIDIGNSLQKIAVFNNDEMVFHQSFPVVSEKILSSVLAQFPIKYSILSSVAGVDAQIIDFLNLNTNVIQYSHQTKLPVTILYKSAETLGLDRIANAVGAAIQFPNRNVLSIQAGTCLVLDFVNENGEYLGGSISPGINMRLEALHEKTKNLPLLRVKETPQSFLGATSEESILFGVVNGICYEIDGFIEDYIVNFENIIVLITGGDALSLQKLLKNTIFAAPNLVLIGLNEIIKYNV
jgi:type III pantothenate kinase